MPLQSFFPKSKLPGLHCWLHLLIFVAMSGVLLLLCSFALAHAEPNQVKSQPLYCITCAAQEVTCISTAVNQCKDRGCQGPNACIPASLYEIERYKVRYLVPSTTSLVCFVVCREAPLETTQTQDQHACDTIMSAASCVTCIGTANCGSDPACADCPTNQLESIVKVKKLVAAGSTEDKEVDLKEALTGTLRSAGCYESKSLMKTCGTQCYSSGDLASCSAKCLKGKGVQSSCASCLGRKIQCTVKNCLNFCAANANSPTCSSCVSRSCGSCNSEKSLTQPEEESFVTALVALSQKDAQDALLRSAGCRESQSLMKTCGTQCYSSGDQASCSAKCLKGKGVQSSCASCLGRKIQCTVKNCLNFCAADANSPTCSSCVSRSCGSCNSEKSLTQPEEESFVTALVALSQKDAQDAVLRSAGCRESQALMKTCGTQCYSSGDQASCSAKCLKGKGVQSSCASCLGRKIQCTVKNCLNFCAADANSPTCSSCVSRSCGSCNSEKSLTQPEEESFVTALVALSQKDAQDAVLRTEWFGRRRRAGCRESQALMKTCGTQCYSSGGLASCSAKCLKGKESSFPVQGAWAGRSSAPSRIARTSVVQMPTALHAPPACPAFVALAIQKIPWHSLRRNLSRPL